MGGCVCVCVGGWERKLETVLDAEKCKKSFALVRISVTCIFRARVMLLIEFLSVCGGGGGGAPDIRSDTAEQLACLLACGLGPTHTHTHTLVVMMQPERIRSGQLHGLGLQCGEAGKRLT